MPWRTLGGIKRTDHSNLFFFAFLAVPQASAFLGEPGLEPATTARRWAFLHRHPLIPSFLCVPCVLSRQFLLALPFFAPSAPFCGHPSLSSVDDIRKFDYSRHPSHRKRRGSQVGRPRSAKPLRVGSTPTPASSLGRNGSQNRPRSIPRRPRCDAKGIRACSRSISGATSPVAIARNESPRQGWQHNDPATLWRNTPNKRPPGPVTDLRPTVACPSSGRYSGSS